MTDMDESILGQFAGMDREQADETVALIERTLDAVPADGGDKVDRVLRARLEGFVMGYRTQHT